MYTPRTLNADTTTTTTTGCHLYDQPITPCHGPLVVVANDEVAQRRFGDLHLKKTWWTEESIFNSIRAVATNRSTWRPMS